MTALPRHFPARPAMVPYVPAPPDIEPDDLTDGLDAARGILNGLLIVIPFWLIVGAIWYVRSHR